MTDNWVQKYVDLVEAVRDVYFAAHWTADRRVDAARLWQNLRDAAGIEPGHSPKSGEDTFTTFIQWKGTDLCMDFNCPTCGEHSHYDGMFAYHIRCGGCGAVWKMPTDVPVERVAAIAGTECVLGPIED